MKKFNFISLLLVCMMIFSACLSGCGAKESADVKALREQLTQFAEDNDTAYFGVDLDMKQFDISIGCQGEQDKDHDTLLPLNSTNTDQEILLTGRFKGSPKEVESFLVVYDPVQKKITQFGMQKLGEAEAAYQEVK